MGRSLITFSYLLFKKAFDIKKRKTFEKFESDRCATGAWRIFRRSVLGSSETRTNAFSSYKYKGRNPLEKNEQNMLLL